MKNDGKALENAVREALKAHQETNQSFFYRFYDTTSARGNFLPESPGDFMWLLPEGAVLVECKSTEKGADILTMIKGSKTSKAQIPRHRIWHRTGHPSIYIWADLVTREVAIYDGVSVVQAHLNKDKELLHCHFRGPLPTVGKMLGKLADNMRV